MAQSSEGDVLSVIQRLESTSPSVVLQALVDVKLLVLTSADKVTYFNANNGVKRLLRLLRKSNERILDATLSVLGNLSFDVRACAEVVACSSTIGLLLGLTAHSQKDSIRGRACRLIGNLAIRPCICKQLHQHGAVKRLVDVIEGKENSVATKHMAVRALRTLWFTHEYRKDMIHDKAVRAVASLLTCPTEEVQQATLKALAVFTASYAEKCALDINGEGDGFTQLVNFLNSSSKPETAIKVLLNISVGPTIRPLLGSAGAVQAAIKFIGDRPPEQYPADVVLLLCALSRESANRSKIRLNGGLKILLNSVRDAAASNTQMRALEALLYFVYDEASLELLVEDGLVEALVAKLATFVKDFGKTHEVCDMNKRARSESPATCSKYPRNNYFRYNSETNDIPATLPRTYSSFMSGNSPESMSSLSPDSLASFRLSPGYSSSPQTSPRSDAYSPVYSSSPTNTDDEDDIGSVSGCSNLSGRANREFLEMTDDSRPFEAPVSARTPLEGCTLLLLSRLSHMVNIVKELADSNTIDTLIQYAATVDKPLPRASRILHRLTRNELYLMPLLLNGFVRKVNSNLMNGPHESCSRCSEVNGLGQALLTQMSVIAETPFGEGELAHQLLCGNRATRSLVILSTPYVVKNKRILKKLLAHSFGGLSSLDLLFQLIKDDGNDGMRDEAIFSLCRLARHVGVIAKSPSASRDKGDCSRESVRTCRMYCSGDEVIEFVLDDGEVVRAEKELLCSGSDVFSAMLTGSFKESGQHRVRLKDVSAQCLSALVSLMKNPEDVRCLKDVNMAFSVLELADRFLIGEVAVKVVKWIQSRLASKTLPLLYKRAIDFQDRFAQSKDIAQDALCYILAGQLVHRARLAVFTEILLSSYNQVFIDDLRQVILLRL